MNKHITLTKDRYDELCMFELRVMHYERVINELKREKRKLEYELNNKYKQPKG